MIPAIGETIYLDFITQNTAGAPTNADSTPAVQVYENGVSLGLSLTVTNIITGLYQVAIPCTLANGFDTGKSYGAYATATISSASCSAMLGNFQMRTGTVDNATLAATQAFNNTGTWTGNLTGTVGTVNALAANVITAASIAADAGTELAAAIWDRLTSALTAVGSIGKALADYLASPPDPLTAQETRDAMKLAPTAGAPITDSIDDKLDVIQAKTDLITTGAIDVISPIDVESGTITIIQGDSYAASESRSVTLESDDWPNLAGASVVMRVASLYTFSFTVLQNTGPGIITRDFTQTETDAFNPDTLDYQIIATLANGHKVTLAQGYQSQGGGFVITPRLPGAPA